MPGKSKYMKAHKEPDADERGGPSDYDKDNPGKRSKESVNYSKGNMAEHCGICKHFQTPNGCELVAGHIVPSFWCRLFAKSKIMMRGALRRK
jgi:hypothetical protein